MLEAYFQAVHDLIADIQKTQTDAIRSVARQAAEAVERGYVLHLLDNGHFLRDELINRSGGLAVLNKLSGPADLSNAFLCRRGDVLFIGSVSGAGEALVDAALRARERGIHTVGLTSLAQSSVAPAKHPSGKHLKDVVDQVLDIRGRAGDAMLDIPGLDQPICPSSGIGATVVMWAVMAETARMLTEKGKPPTVFRSVNLPDGQRIYEEQVAQFLRRGY